MSVERILRESVLDWHAVRRQYDTRVEVSGRSGRLLNENRSADFARVALGISDPNGNYSARERGLGPRILAENPKAIETIINLAREFHELRSGERVDEILHRAAITNVGIAVGSELACLMNPTVMLDHESSHGVGVQPAEKRRQLSIGKRGNQDFRGTRLVGIPPGGSPN